ncbi:unnamed protein product [Lathyrus sativus]|nr:unnamed protein product [Lathyrus sativus]
MNFMDFVKQEWISIQVEGSVSHIILEKFKALSNRLRWWNTNIFGWVDLKVELSVERLNELEEDLLDEDGFVAEEKVISIGKAQVEVWNNFYLKESLIKQKYRAKWVKEWDCNTKYIHSQLKARVRSNPITALKVGSTIITYVFSIKHAARDHFLDKFSSSCSVRPSMDLSGLISLPIEESLQLEEPFSSEEIHFAVFDCEGNKSPGPDGFNLYSIKTC